jgi:hypothetical protein
MKELLAVFMLFNMSNSYAESQYSRRQVCESLMDNNTKYYCLFKLTYNNEYCGHIPDRTIRDICLAEYDNLSAKCSYIIDHDLRLLCIAQQK